MISLCLGRSKVRWRVRGSSSGKECAATRITGETVIVPNVDEFPGHIACSTASKSEIVVPIFNGVGDVFGVLDVDSDLLDDFSEIDREGLTQVVRVIERFIQSHTNSDKIE